MAAEFLLGEYCFPVGRNLEHTSGGRNQAQGCDFLLLGLEDLVRHTDGMGKITSTCAVLNADLGFSGQRPPPINRPIWLDRPV